MDPCLFHEYSQHNKSPRRAHRSLHSAASVRFAEQLFRQSRPTFSRMELKEKFKTLVLRLVMLSIYMTSGAAIFSALEHDQTDDNHFKEQIIEVKKNMSQKFNASMEVINDFIQTLEHLILKNRKNCKFQHNDWNYYQSLYFVGSVTTTIGYGHLSPKTQSGRLFLIFFAIFGIPLNLLTLQSVGELINIVVYFIIRYVEKVFLKRETPSNEHVKCFAISAFLMILMLPLGGVMYYYSEQENGWTFLDSVYYCFTALSTIGFGDLVPNEGKAPNEPYEKAIWFFRLLYLGLGLSLVSSVFTSICSAAKEIRALLPCKKGDYKVGGKSSVSEKVSNCFLTTCCRFGESDGSAILRSGSFCSNYDETETTSVLSMNNISLSHGFQESRMEDDTLNEERNTTHQQLQTESNECSIVLKCLERNTDTARNNGERSVTLQNENDNSFTENDTRISVNESDQSQSKNGHDKDAKEMRIGSKEGKSDSSNATTDSSVSKAKQAPNRIIPQILVNGLHVE